MKLQYNHKMYKEIMRPLLGRLDSETWHSRARDALHVAEITPFTLKFLEQFAYRRQRVCDERLQVVVDGVTFENPVLVGAGWDKVGHAVKALYTLGFAGVEVGSVLASPQDGNPKPRQFMLSPDVALNRLGFNSPGMHVVARNLAGYAGSGIPIGISIGKNKEVEAKDAAQVHAVVAERLYKYAAYFAVNVSSPNTPGLRALQEKGPLTDIVQAVNAVMEQLGGRKPLFVKIAPELSHGAIDDVIQVVLENHLTGIIATNTTINPDIKAKYGERWRNEAGGLSGDDSDYRAMATAIVAHIYRATQGKLIIMGVGGVKDTDTALAKIKAGATLVQVVTGIRGEGTSLPGRINCGILDYMKQHDVKHVSELVGIDVRRATV
jgi:dihydroorotate dehydrogenase